MRILLTGAAGFVGHHVLESLLDHEEEYPITILDRLEHASADRIAEVMEIYPSAKGRVRFLHHDLRAPIGGYLAQQLKDITHVMHLAAASHVDRSIEHPLEFVMDNVVGTCNLLNWARKKRVERFLYFSTDEVFGPAPRDVRYKEDDRYRSGNPYAATKAGAEELCVAFHNTYQLPVVITHTMNVIGIRQHPEKFLPTIIRSLRDGKTITVHCDRSRKKPGSRYYISAQDVAEGAHFVLMHGTSGEKYNLVGRDEISNLRLVKMVAEIMGAKPSIELVDFHSSRPGHDLRYALDGRKMGVRFGWAPMPIHDVLDSIVDWTLKNPRWLDYA